jgi:uncharacterized protein (TIGR02266 family)
VGTKQWKVLLADDVELFLELERTFLQREDIDLLVAHDGAEALAIVRTKRPDLVLLDLYMPRLDGPEVCRTIKSDPQLRATTVLMVTSGGSESERARCAEAGCDAILTKPINRHTFLTTVRGHLSIVEREAHRVPARLLVRFGTGGDHILTDWSVNLSTGGVFIETRHLFAVDEALAVSFVLPDRVEELRCRARVAWVNHPELPLKRGLPPGIGLQFLDLSGSERLEILAFVKRSLLSPLW